MKNNPRILFGVIPILDLFIDDLLIHPFMIFSFIIYLVNISSCISFIHDFFKHSCDHGARFADGSLSAPRKVSRCTFKWASFITTHIHIQRLDGIHLLKSQHSFAHSAALQNNILEVHGLSSADVSLQTSHCRRQPSVKIT